MSKPVASKVIELLADNFPAAPDIIWCENLQKYIFASGRREAMTTQNRQNSAAEFFILKLWFESEPFADLLKTK